MKNLFPPAVSTLLLMLAACAPTQRQTIVSHSPESYASKAQSDGLAAGAQPFDTYPKSTSVLGKNVSREFTPVQLVVESAATDKFLVHRDGAKLICADGKSLEPVSGLAMFEHYREPAMVGSLLGLSTLRVIAAETNEQTKSDWMNKEFPAMSMVKTGGRVGGLLYFRGTCPLRLGRRLLVTADKMASSDVVSLSIELR